MSQRHLSLGFAIEFGLLHPQRLLFHVALIAHRLQPLLQLGAVVVVALR